MSIPAYFTLALILCALSAGVWLLCYVAVNLYRVFRRRPMATRITAKVQPDSRNWQRLDAEARKP